MAMIEQGANALAGSGFFNCMLGGGDAVTGGGGCGGGNPAAFDLEDGKVVRCYCAFGRTWLHCEDQSVSIPETGNRIIVAKIDHSNAERPRLTVAAKTGDDPSTALVNNASVTERPLYIVKDGAVEADLRTAPTITAWTP